VNDVILAAVTRGFRDLLETRGEDPTHHQIHTLVPVSVRVEHGVMDNEVSALVADLPVRFSTPELRYEAICAETQRLKASSEAEAGEAVTRLAELVPAPLMAFGTRATSAFLRRRPQRNVTTVTTNVPGPQFPLYAAGRRMLTYYPFVPVAFGVRYAIAILSYDGDLYFGLTGDKECSPDLGVLAKGIEAGFAELLPDGPP
jgi:diacylglycerol O-acyltransferase / wax synthase